MTKELRTKVIAWLSGAAATVAIVSGIIALDVRWWPWIWELQAMEAKIMANAEQISDFRRYALAREQLELEQRLFDSRQKLQEATSPGHRQALNDFIRTTEERILDVKHQRGKIQ